jgi:hypothetical protein
MGDCECGLCKNRKDFDFPSDLLSRLAEGNVVIFAGAGVSTENRDHCNTTLYDEIKHELGETSDLDFPNLMDRYCAQIDGRIKLTQKIRERIEYFRSFRGFYVNMTRFHRALRPLFMVRDLVTTNWDDFFEVEAGFDPFVYEQDVAFLEGSERRVIKIHGSISNLGSIVATSEDYRKSLRRLSRGTMGAYLKSLLATKTIIYIGYSLRDPNYLRLAQTMARLTKPFTRTSYFVSPRVDHDYLKKTRLSLFPLETDGAYFLEQFRIHYKKLEEHPMIVDEDPFNECEDLLSHVNELHEYTADTFLKKRNPLLIFALSYQDGLQDALMRIKDSRKRGRYHNTAHLHDLVHGYEVRVSRYRRERNLWDACYCRGYQNGLIFLLSGGDGGYPPPVELLFDQSVDSVSKVVRFPKKRVPGYAKRQLDRLFARVASGGLIPEHIPYV